MLCIASDQAIFVFVSLGIDFSSNDGVAIGFVGLQTLTKSAVRPTFVA